MGFAVGFEAGGGRAYAEDDACCGGRGETRQEVGHAAVFVGGPGCDGPLAEEGQPATLTLGGMDEVERGAEEAWVVEGFGDVFAPGFGAVAVAAAATRAGQAGEGLEEGEHGVGDGVGEGFGA